MAELKADVLVLGAGMVGVGAALHLQKRGRDTVLIDRHAVAGEETSYGNGGLIECASVFPYMFPRDFRQILQYASNRTPQVRYHFSDLPLFLPWLAALSFWHVAASGPAVMGAIVWAAVLLATAVMVTALNMKRPLANGGWSPQAPFEASTVV